ncbi:MAG: hypothetical protein HEQ24_17475 [Dolichospermum sp. BR01]|jgi:hypothetical protein|nr:hypothetical protein [Dolichospermum sp. BR01]
MGTINLKLFNFGKLPKNASFMIIGEYPGMKPAILPPKQDKPHNQAKFMLVNGD